jgi:hypothetical protein
MNKSLKVMEREYAEILREIYLLREKINKNNATKEDIEKIRDLEEISNKLYGCILKERRRGFI